MNWLHRLAAWAVVSLCIAGCSKPASDHSQNADPHDVLAQILDVKSKVLSQTATPQAYQASDLLTDDDIREITGYPVVKKTRGPAHGIYQNGCEWELDSGAGSFGVNWTITLGVMSPGGRKYFDTYLTFDNPPPVPGLGDVAICTMAGSLTAVKGDTLVDLQYVNFSNSKQDVPRKLIERIFSRVR